MPEKSAHEEKLTPQEKACPLTAARDLCNAGNFERAIYVLKWEKEYARAALIERKLGREALIINNVGEAGDHYSEAFDLYEKEIQKWLREDALKLAGQAALNKSELFGELGQVAMEREEQARALDLFKAGGWKDEAIKTATRMTVTALKTKLRGMEESGASAEANSTA